MQMSYQEALVLLVPVTMGLVEVIKGLLPFKPEIVVRLIPAISLFLGIAINLVWFGISRDAWISGIITGLSASGLWSGARSMIKGQGGVKT